MAVQVVRLANASRRTRVTPRTNTDNSLEMSRLIYQKLSSLTLNRTILRDYNEGKLPKEYVDFLDQCNEILYNQTWGPTYDIDDATLALDEYLAELGVTAEYQYVKDTKSIPAWLTSPEKSDYRVLVEYPTVTPNSTGTATHTTDPIFILMDKDEVLVSYPKGL